MSTQPDFLHQFLTSIGEALQSRTPEGAALLRQQKQQEFQSQQDSSNSEEAWRQKLFLHDHPSKYEEENLQREKDNSQAQRDYQSQMLQNDSQRTQNQGGIDLASLMEKGFSPSPTGPSLSPAFPAQPTDPNSVQVGGKFLTPPKIRMITPPKDSILSQLYGEDPIPENQIHPSILDNYVKGEEAKQRNSVLGDQLEGQAKLTHSLIDDSITNPTIKRSFHNEVDTAKLSDKRTGSTTQSDGIQNKIRDYIIKTDPQASKDLINQEVAKAYATSAASERGRMSVTSSNPETIGKAADMVQADPTGNFDAVTKLHGGDKQFMRDLAGELDKRGTSLEKLSNQAKESREYATVAQKEMIPLLSKISALDQQGKLGPYASRMNSFMQGKIGAADPEFAQFSGDVDLMRKLVAKIHLGVRGAGSPQNAEMMKQKLDEGKMDAPTLKAGLAAYKDFVDVYARMGMNDVGGKSGNGGSGMPLTNQDIQQLIHSLDSIVPKKKEGN